MGEFLWTFAVQEMLKKVVRLAAKEIGLTWGLEKELSDLKEWLLKSETFLLDINTRKLHNDSVRSIGSEFYGNHFNQHLRVLQILECSKLTKLPNGLQFCHSIQHLRLIDNCSFLALDLQNEHLLMRLPEMDIVERNGHCWMHSTW